SMTSRPMPSPPMTAMCKAAIAISFSIFYRTARWRVDTNFLTNAHFSRHRKRVNMQRVRQPGKGRHPAAARRRAVLAVCAGLAVLALGLSVGCNGTGTRVKDHPQQPPEVDPLMGGIQPSKKGPYEIPTPGPTPAERKAKSTAAPAAPTSGTTSPAAL